MSAQSKTLDAQGPMAVSLRVLIAEDEPLLQMALEDILNDLGCEVVASVATVKDTLTCIGQHTFNIAILDVHLADGAVDPVVQRLTAMSIPMVFATGALSADQYPGPVVGKPYDLAEIKRAIASVADKAG